MDITEVRLSLKDDERLKAFACITLDGCFVVRGLKVINGPNGMFVAMPSRKKPDGTYQDIAHPINNETRRMVEGCVLAEYRKQLGAKLLELPDVPAEGLDGETLP
ncbi:MAG: septation regulator SpoVG [Candidatus Eisenbacteria sp.]|nr:septation regulator SpoVG [Candidatus Eisenbacteria bacterium]